ncbi:carbohydrate sulfotransferase 11-like [Scylla paramamosain]|uniref:carbohydrate sulfotransferase 11-like n=1 Tax=Scylla paramamosain TaxID=85552 RepID=UPI003083B3E3
MSKTRVVACLVVVVVVTWYAISFQHLQLRATQPPAAATTTTTTKHTLSYQVLGTYLHTSTHHSTRISTLNAGKPYRTQNSTHKPESYSEEKWKSVMHGRLARVAKLCRQHPQALNRFDLFSVFKSLTVDPAHHLVYCRNAKAGTTAWLSRLLQWAGISFNTTADVHTIADQAFPMVATDRILRELKRSSLTFTVARHPFTRLVSAYRNKIEENYKPERWSEIMRKYRTPINITTEVNNSRPTEMNNSRPTFREFALFASDEVLRCLGQARPSCLDEVDVHWLPHHDRCAPCNINYDVIAKMETKDEDEAYISHLLGLPLPPPTQQNVASGPSSDSLTRTFFSTLSASERQRVFKAYEYDFLMFEYSYNDKDYR